MKYNMSYTKMANKMGNKYITVEHHEDGTYTYTNPYEYDPYDDDEKEINKDIEEVYVHAEKVESELDILKKKVERLKELAKTVETVCGCGSTCDRCRSIRILLDTAKI